MVAANDGGAGGGGGGEFRIERSIGLWSAVSLIVGTSIGSGIFISPKGVLLYSGSVGMSLVVWVLCGVLSMLGGLCYAELGSSVLKSGGEWAYIKRGLGAAPAFLSAWMGLFLGSASLATLCLAFAQYSVQPFVDACGPPTVLLKLLAVAAVWTIVGVNALSVTLATRLSVALTAVKLLALVAIVAGGLWRLAAVGVDGGSGGGGGIASGFAGTSVNAFEIANAFYSGLWAFEGWNNLNYVTEELRNPKRNLPLSIVLSVVILTVVYLLVNVSYLSVLSKDELLRSDAVAADWAQRLFAGGAASFAVSVAVACSTFGSAHGTTYGTGRVLFVSAREGHMVELMAMIGVEQKTPKCSLLFRGVMATAMVIPSNIDELVDFFSFCAWLFYGMSFLSLIVLRRREKELPRPFRVPLAVPAFMLLAAGYLTVAPIISKPSLPFLYAFLFMLSGLGLYFPFVHFKLRWRGLDKVTLFLQLLLRVAPGDHHDE